METEIGNNIKLGDCSREKGGDSIVSVEGLVVVCVIVLSTVVLLVFLLGIK